MFGIGTTELIVILFVAVILINPRELPKLMRKAGNIYARGMRQWNGFRKSMRELQREIDKYSRIENEQPINSEKKEKE